MRCFTVLFFKNCCCVICCWGLHFRTTILRSSNNAWARVHGVYWSSLSSQFPIFTKNPPHRTYTGQLTRRGPSDSHLDSCANLRRSSMRVLIQAPYCQSNTANAGTGKVKRNTQSSRSARLRHTAPYLREMTGTLSSDTVTGLYMLSERCGYKMARTA